MSFLEQEIKEGVDFLGKFKSQQVLDFVSKIKPPILIAAMGSSYYLPTGRAESLSHGFEKHPDVRFILASEGYNINPKSWESLVLISNSGKSREILTLAQKFPKDKIFAITGSITSELGKAAGHVYELQTGKEKAVAATKSIIEQTLVCESLIRYLAEERSFTKIDLAPISRAMRENFKKKIPISLLVNISGARTVYFVGGSSGIGEEIALKFVELAKKKAKFIPGTQILHGAEEVIEKGDVIFLLFAERYKNYFDRFKSLKEKTDCHIYTIGKDVSFAETALDVELVSGFKPYCMLPYFWSMLTQFAKLKGFSLDKGDKIAKVGVASK